MKFSELKIGQLFSLSDPLCSDDIYIKTHSDASILVYSDCIDEYEFLRTHRTSESFNPKVNLVIANFIKK